MEAPEQPSRVRGFPANQPGLAVEKREMRRLRGPAPAARTAALLEAAFQHGHQVDDLGARSLFRGFLGRSQHVGLAHADLLVDPAHQVAAISVLELLGLPCPAHLVDQATRHRDLLSRYLDRTGIGRRKLEVLGRYELFRKAQRVEHERPLANHDGAEMLPAADDEAADCHLRIVPHRFAKQGIGLLTTLGRLEVVRRLEVLGRDVGSFDETHDVDRLRRFDIRSPEILVRQCDVLALLVLIALHDVAPVDDLAGALVVALVSDGGEVAAVEHVEVQRAVARRGMEVYRDVDEPERDRAFPHGARVTSAAVAARRATVARLRTAAALALAGLLALLRHRFFLRNSGGIGRPATAYPAQGGFRASSAGALRTL